MRRPCALTLLLVVALAGCGGLKKGGLTPVGNQEATHPPKDSQSSAKVQMVDISFSPGTVRIRPGGKVTWVNNDKVAHTVTVGDELYNSLNSGPLGPGERYTRTFNKPRQVGYRCTIHPNMEGTIFVEKD